MFGKGISVVGDIVDLAANIDVINKSGAWYAYNGQKIGQGKDNAKTYLKEHPEVRDEIEEKIRALLAGKEVAEDAQAADSADEDEEEFLGIDI